MLCYIAAIEECSFSRRTSEQPPGQQLFLSADNVDLVQKIWIFDHIAA